jgi:hypothetical protein
VKGPPDEPVGAATLGAVAPEDVFAGSPAGLSICARVLELVDDLDVEVRSTRSQVALRRRRGFAYLWHPGHYVRSDVPAVLSIALPAQVSSPRFKEVVHPAPGIWMHHLELDDPAQVDDEVLGWLHAAYDAAG